MTADEFMSKVGIEGLEYAISNYYDGNITDDEELDHLVWLASKEIGTLQSYIEQKYGDLYDY